jgi:hypothetical protein
MVSAALSVPSQLPAVVPPLYERLLGEAFQRLPRAVRAFHEKPGGASGRGLFRIELGKGLLRRLFARMIGLRREGPVETVLEVVADGEREVWRRSFGEMVLETVQWQEGPYLIEQRGPMRFVMRVEPAPLGMRFSVDHARLFGVRLPRFLSPRIDAIAEGDAETWRVEVVVSAPLLGRVVTYRGQIEPSP